MMNSLQILLLLLSLAQFALFKTLLIAAQELAPIVTLPGGQVQGIVETGLQSHKVHFYQGIKYGQAKRFRKPEKAPAWSGIYNATMFRYACPQPEIALSNHSYVDQPQTLHRTRYSNEDCLYLNVFRPAEQATEQKRAVMVWVHGGTFVGGTIFDKGFDSHHISTLGDVIVVTLNYRVGALGFLLGDDAEHPGNLGLYDQILALEWIKENIAHFGGDPNQVTLFGESAGAMSVGALILSTHANGLFHRVILQSGSPNSFVGSENRTSAHGKVKFLASFLSCGGDTLTETLHCIESKTPEQIQTITNTMSKLGQFFEPSYGTELLPLSPVEALKAGKFNTKLDILFGVNRDEGASGVYSLFSDIKPDSGKLITIDSVKDAINVMTQLFKVDNHTEVAEWYTRALNTSDQVAMRNAVANVYGDFNLVCPTMFFGDQYAKLANPANRYYTYRLVQPITYGVGGCPEWMGVCHAHDLSYVFGHTLDAHKQQPDHRDYRLSWDIIHAWTSFAKSGHPGKMGGGGQSESMSSVEWTEAFDRNTHGSAGLAAMRTMWLDANDYKMVTGFFAPICDPFWRPRIF